MLVMRQLKSFSATPIAVLVNRFLLAIVLCLSLTSCGFLPESSFDLSSESRLPRWFALPSDIPRSDAAVTMNYYVGSNGRTAKFVLRDTRQNKTIAEVSGQLAEEHPLKRKTSAPGTASDYPSYEVVTVNGVPEVIEHRRLEPIFYIVDDPLVRAELGVTNPQ